MDIEDIEVFIGINVGKSKHWTTALNRDGQKVLDKVLPNNGDRLHEAYQRSQAKGQVLVVVDQPATVGALTVAVAQDMGIIVGYLPELSTYRTVGLTPGSVKIDAKDAAVITQAVRTMPHTLRAISTSDEDAATSPTLTGFDLNLARQVNQTANRIRGLYTQIHPASERVLGPWLERDAALEVIAAQLTPADLRRMDRVRANAKLKKHRRRRHATWAGQTIPTLEHQIMVIASTDAVAVMLPYLARQLIALHAQRADVAAQAETLVQTRPLYQVLASMPGIRVRTVAVFLAETLGKILNIGTQLVSYAELAPVTHHSGSPIRGEHVSHGGNKKLKRATFLSIFASLCSDPVSRACYQRKRDQGKRHNQTVLALVHRRTLVLHAMIRNGALYDSQPVVKLLTAA